MSDAECEKALRTWDAYADDHAPVAAIILAGNDLADALRDERDRFAQQIEEVRALLFDPIADYYGELRQKFEDIVSPGTPESEKN